MKKRFYTVCLSLILSVAGPALYSLDSYSLSRSVFSEASYNESILTINQYGYYSVITKSKHGTGLTLVNQMTGPVSPQGSPGDFDGRIDMLLDEGKYKIRMYGTEHPDDRLSLEVRPYKELNLPQSPVLNPDQYIQKELGDLEQLSYWIEVKKDNDPVYLEMQGRNLSRVVIWKDGSWVEDVRSFKKTVEFEAGRPLTSIIINTTLPKGYYKVTAYGGPEQKWAKQSTAHPFRLHYGLAGINPNSRFAGKISPYGVNRYIIQGSADFYLLQANEKKDYKLKVQSLSKNEDFDHYDYLAEITKKSSTPQCTVNRSYYNGTIMICVEGTPGDPFVLQTLYSSQSMYVSPRTSGKYWVSTVHTGFIGDNVDASGFLVDTYGTDKVVAQDLPELNMKQGWTRTFNLLDNVTVYFEVSQGGSYEIDYSGVTARTRIERFLTSYPQNYRSPDFESGNRVVKLEKGINVLTIQPEKKGIINFQIKPKGLALGKKSDSPFQGNVQIPSIHLDKNHGYRFYTGQQGEVRSGVQLRELPLDLRQSLSIYLKAGETIEIPALVYTPSVVGVSSESGSAYELSRNGQILEPGKSRLDTGSVTLSLKNKGAQTEMYSIQFVDINTLPEAEPKYLSTKVLDSFPDFEIISANKVHHFDLEARARKVYLLKVDKAGIYKIQSTGLLKTRAVMRDRLTPSMGSAEANGPGRNFLLQSFLKEGIYQISIETLGSSAGHLGVLLEYIPPREGGELVLDKAMKATVPAGDSLIYRFNIPVQGRYQLNTIGMSRDYPCRVEDSQGYPLFAPSPRTDFNHVFSAGAYRLISLPQEVEGKRLTTLAQALDPKELTGKGPIPLALNSRRYNQWKATEGDKREPDIYTFSLPATMPVTISFTATMWARLYSVTGGQHKLIKKIYPDDKTLHELDAGSYSLEFMPLRKDNLVDYSVDLSTQVLVDGLSYTTSPGRNFEVLVEVPSLVEFSSEGKTDVFAELYDEKGRLLEVVDDSLNDWNFIFSRYLQAGKYRLWVSTRSGYGNTRIAMNILRTVYRPALSPSSGLSVDMEARKNEFPLALAPGYYHLNIDANSQLALSLLEKNKDSWQDKAVIKGIDFDWYFYLPTGTSYGMALWSLDHIDEELKMKLQPFTPRDISLSELKKGLTIQPRDGGIALSVRLDQAAAYRLECVNTRTGQTVSQVYTATQRDSKQALMWKQVRNNFVSSASGTLLFNASSPDPLRITLSELSLSPDSPVGLSLQGGEKAFLKLAKKKEKVTLVLARGSIGQPLVSFTGGSSPIQMSDGTTVDPDFAFHHASALTVSLQPDPGPVLVWNPLSELGESGISLDYYDLAIAAPQVLSGPDEGHLSSRQTRSYRLNTAAHFEVALAPGMAAFTWDESGVTEIHYSYQSQALFTFRTKARNLTIINIAQSQARYHVSMRNAIPVYQKGSLLVENNFVRTGYIEDEITASRHFTQLYSSPNLRISLLQADGSLSQAQEGEALNIRPGYYRYVLEHKAEYSKAWMGSELLMDRWGLQKPAGVKKMDSPGYVDAGQLQWYKLNTTGPSVVQLSSQNDFVAALVVDGKFSSVNEVTGPDSSVAYLPNGIVLLGLRAPAQADEGGGKVYVNWRPVEDIHKNLGKTLILTDTDARAFSFTLKEHQEVALAYQAPSDLIDCQLFNKQGELIADGPVIFTELDAGDYVVIYNLSEDLDYSEFSPIYVDTRTIEDKILADKVREFLTKYGYIKGNE